MKITKKQIMNFNPYLYKKTKLADIDEDGDGDEDDGDSEINSLGVASANMEFSLPYNLIMINGEINGKTSRVVTEMLLAYDIKNKIQGWVQPIHMLINSGGGSVVDAWQICDVMNAIDTPVFTIGSGQIASAALTIFINGYRGYRILSEHTSVMSHQYSWGVVGKMDDLVSAHKEFNNIYKRMEDHFHRNTGLSKKIIKEKLLGGLDNWMNAEEAKKMKLADKVCDFKKISPFIIAEPPKEIMDKIRKRNSESKKKNKDTKDKKEVTNGKRTAKK
jgi:ATP-dependent Clp protease protease subunit